MNIYERIKDFINDPVLGTFHRWVVIIGIAVFLLAVTIPLAMGQDYPVTYNDYPTPVKEEVLDKTDEEVMEEANPFQSYMLDPTFQINGNCSATVVKSGVGSRPSAQFETLLLTAAHCMKGRAGWVSDYVFDEDQKRVVMKREYAYEMVGSNSNFDLALIRLLDRERVFPVAEIAPEGWDVRVGDATYALGYPLGWEKALTTGIITGKINMAKFDSNKYTDKWRYKSSTPVTFGNSGGGFYTQDGDRFVLIGVVSSGLTQFEHQNQYSTLENVRYFLRFRDIL